MSKYEPLWRWIAEHGTDRFQLTFDEIEAIALVPLDHSFLRYKKELEEYGFRVEKISIKEQTVTVCREKCELGIGSRQDRKAKNTPTD